MKLFPHVLRYSYRTANWFFLDRLGRSHSTRLIHSIADRCTDKTYNMKYCVVQKGATNTLDYKIYFKNDSGFISPFHDIPVYSNEADCIVNMVVEIPRWSNAKMEITKNDPLNPIKQDVKNGKLRFVANCFPHHGYIWNYGAIPQTWENPNVNDEHTGFKGDNDPVDIMEIGQRIARRGEIMQVKVLGCLALIDEGETDWKIFGISTKDPLADSLKDISDVEKYCPGLLKASIEWLRTYKIPDGKPENQFAFGGEFKDKAFAHKIINETHKEWKCLMAKDEDKINLTNTTLGDTKTSLGRNEAEQIVNSNPNYSEGPPLDDIVGKWHFLHLK
ncbi:inorganic pyrophosphatase [Cimex lectularius]|uniref:Inorganic pyrophosphatase n=1 Tax=Cimex lectularius TaxID=79782 RepID=A0A8I6S178_CIMLE|nr:inorganic pyrophosphatase [Cimex lectularius]